MLATTNVLKNREPRPPRPHQQEAIDAALVHFRKKGADIRGTIVMACGSGKTDVGQRVSESLGERCLYTAPSLGLIEQAIRNGREHGARDRYNDILVVCSDKSVVTPNQDEASITAEDLGATVTTDPRVVRKFLRNKSGLIFSTNQSIPVLQDAFAGGGVRPLDHVTVDEAHVTTGLAGKLFSLVVDQSIVPSRTRLFLTATPKILSSKTKNEDAQTFYSMDDKTLYGERLYSLSFRDAIARRILSDYQLIITVIRQSEARSWGLKTGTVLPEVLGVLGTLKAADEHGLTKAITFHSSVRRAKEAEQILTQLKSNSGLMKGMGINWCTEGWHINGAMPASERKRILNVFANAPDDVFSVVTNCRCLGVGIDVPKMDTIVIFDPKRDEVDLIQAVGRIMRKYKGKDHGTVLVPLVVPDSLDVDEVVQSSEFRKVIDVVRALKAHDDRLALSIRNTCGNSVPNVSSIEMEGPKVLLPLTVSKGLLDAIKLRVLEEAVRIAPQDMSEAWLESVIDEFRRLNENRFPSDVSGELPGFPGMLFSTVNSRIRSGHLKGYVSLSDFIDKRYAQERQELDFDLTPKNLRRVIDNYRANNDGSFPSVYSGSISPGHKLTFSILNGRLLAGSLATYTSLADFINKEYHEDRRKLEFSVFTLRAEVEEYRKLNQGRFPTMKSGQLPNYPGSTFAAISEQLRCDETVPYISIPDFCAKEFKDHPDNLEMTSSGLRVVVDAYRKAHGMRFPTAASGEVPGFSQLEFSAIDQRLKKGVIPGVQSLGEFIDVEYATERVRVDFKLTLKNLREVVRAHRKANSGNNPTVRSADVPGYPGLNFTALNARIKNGEIGFSSLKDFLDNDPEIQR